jgi:hypothetical protein
VLPYTDGRAIDDPNTALLLRFRTSILRRMIVLIGCLAVFGAIDYVSVADSLVPGEIFIWFMTVVLLVLVVFALWLHLPQQRRGKALLSRYGWRGVPATLLADKPCLVRIALGDTALTLRLTRLNWIAKQALLRTGTLWICGPDEQGQALVRVAGSVGQALADVTNAAPTGAPPVPQRPNSQRPADDPGLAWARRAFHRSMLIILGVVVLLAGINIGILSRSGFGTLGTNAGAFGQVIAAPIMLIVLAWGYVAGFRQFRRYAAAPYWVPVQVSLDSWDGPPNMAVRTGAGRVILPNGWRCYADFPRLPLDLAANLRGTGVLWLAGDPVPGATLPIGLPGYAVRGTVKLRG